MKMSRTEAVRVVVQELGKAGLEVTSETVAERLGVQTFKDKKLVLNILGDLFKAGELKRVQRGIYRWVGKQSKTSKEYLMWRRLRKGGATVRDLMVFSGASEAYVKEWLNFLRVSGLIAHHQETGIFRLVKDQVELPKNDWKAEKLRRLREQVKAARFQVTALRDTLVSCVEAAELACAVMREMAAGEDADAAIEAEVTQ